MPAAQPVRPSRRTVLRTGVYAVGAAALGGPLAGCGARVEPGPEGFPDLPFAPARTPAPGEAALLTLWSSTLDLRDAALALADAALDVGGNPVALATTLAGLHSDQGQLLQAALDDLGVPAAVQVGARTGGAAGGGAGGGGSADPTTGGSTAAPPSTGTTDLATAEAAGASSAESLAAVAAVPEAAFPSAATLLAQRAAAAELLGTVTEWPPAEWTDPSAAQDLLTALWAASYGLEVVVAQAGTARAELAESTLATLRARRRALSEVLGADAEPPAAGWALPFPVTTPQAAQRLAVHVLGGLRTAVAAAVVPVRGQAGALPDALATLAEAEVLAHRWGLPLMAFPGLR